MPALITSWGLDLADLAPDAPSDTVELVGTDLLRRWDEPQRCYHTTTHLVEMFWALEELETAGELDARDASLARVAAWFHDAVYEPTAAPGDNEAASAELAATTLPALSVEPQDCAAVVRLVHLSIQHESPARTGLDAAFQDADLWILGAPPDRFDAYCREVRQEYAHVPDEAYRRGRVGVLSPLVQRESVYCTEHARQRWQPAARANLAREIARLRG
ncbi:MAG TPA: hypothetical protein VFJ97_08825 [Dermatophilaceae bacterium]|nr:hypothetical protein [Dermatophilaceae bacterium]